MGRYELPYEQQRRAMSSAALRWTFAVSMTLFVLWMCFAAWTCN